MSSSGGYVVVLSIGNFLVSFHFDSSNNKVRWYRVIRSNYVRQYGVDLKS